MELQNLDMFNFRYLQDIQKKIAYSKQEIKVLNYNRCLFCLDSIASCI